MKGEDAMRQAAGRIAAGILTAICIWVGRNLSLLAAQTGVLQISYSCGETTPIEGAEFSAVCVADGTVQKGRMVYTLKKEYQTCGRNPQKPEFWEDKELPDVLLKCYQKSERDAAKKQRTDSSGNAYFTNCSAGIYLVWQSGSEKDSKEYDTAGPLLVTVPENASAKSGDWSWSTRAYPKTSAKPTAIETDAAESNTIAAAREITQVMNAEHAAPEISENRGDGTGDDFALYGFLAAAIFSAAGLAGYGWMHRKIGKKNRRF